MEGQTELQAGAAKVELTNWSQTYPDTKAKRIHYPVAKARPCEYTAIKDDFKCVN